MIDNIASGMKYKKPEYKETEETNEGSKEQKDEEKPKWEFKDGKTKEEILIEGKRDIEKKNVIEYVLYISNSFFKLLQ